MKNAIEIMKRKGYKVYVGAKDKSITYKLLRENNIEFHALGKLDSTFSKLKSLVTYSIKIRKLMKKYNFSKDDVVIGISPIHGLIAAKSIGINKRITFSDTDFAPEQVYIYSPLSTKVFTPNWFRLKLFGTKHIKYNGTHEMAYLNKKYFKPNDKILQKYNLQENKYIITRFSKWDATHDFGKRGIQNYVKFVERIIQRYDLLITSEFELPSKLKTYEFTGDKNDFHDILYFSAGYIGEAITVAGEALVLGKPTVVINPIYYEQFNFMQKQFSYFVQLKDEKNCLNIFENIIEQKNQNKNEFRIKDITDLIIASIE
jgi:hypothetical protein